MGSLNKYELSHLAFIIDALVGCPKQVDKIEKAVKKYFPKQSELLKKTIKEAFEIARGKKSEDERLLGCFEWAKSNYQYRKNRNGKR